MCQTLFTRWCGKQHANIGVMLCLSLLISILPCMLFSQNPGMIHGQVMRQDSSVAAFSTVQIIKSVDSSILKAVIAGVDGMFSAENIPDGTYRVVISSVGYRTLRSKPFSLSEGNRNIDLGQFVLKASSNTLQSVEVRVKKPLIENKIDRIVYNVENSILSSGISAMDVLRKIPGISITNGEITLVGKSGVNVLIDGKSTYLSAGQLATLLNSMEATSLSSVEIMTNPSAKYDASGSAGIINVVLTRDKKLGTNVTITGFAGYGNFYKASAGVRVNHRSNKVNIFGNYGFLTNEKFENLDIDRTNISNSQATYFTQSTRKIIKNQNQNYRAGIDYYIDKRNTIGIIVSGLVHSGSASFNGTTLIGSQAGAVDSSLVAYNPNTNSSSNTAWDLNYKSTFDSSGQELSVDVAKLKFTSDIRTTYYSSLFNKNGTSLAPDSTMRNFTPSDINIISAKADYTHPIRKFFKIEMGAKASWVKSENIFDFQHLQNDAWVNNPQMTNSFIYKEDIYAGYVNISGKVRHTELQAGLRAEQTNSVRNSPTLNNIVSSKYLNLFPTAFINQALSRNSVIRFSVGRRIDRPNYTDLNPFVYYLDKYTYFKGNPYLQPQYTYLYELSYRYKKAASITLGYSNTSNVISDVILPDTVAKTLFLTKENLNKQKSYNLNIILPLPLTKWWTSYNNIVVAYSRFKTADFLGSFYDVSQTTAQFSSNNEFSINKTSVAQIAASYQSPFLIGTFTVKTRPTIDVAIRKKFMNDKIGLNLSLSDVFNSLSERINSKSSELIYFAYQKIESRVVRLAITYRFGNTNVRSNNKSDGLSDEKGRLSKKD
jgi:hypothetical protein